MNLGTDQEPKSIQVYKGMEEYEYEQWFGFLNTIWMFLLGLIKI